MRPEDTAITFEDDPVRPETVGRFPLLAWWNGLDPRDQALYQGLVPLSLGLAADPWTRPWALGLIAPGLVMTMIAAAYLIVPVLRRSEQ